MPEHAPGAARGGGAGRSRDPGAGTRRLARDDEEVDRAADGEVDRGERDKRLAPAERLDQRVGEGEEHRAGKAADERHDGDAAPGERPEAMRQDGEAGLVEDGAHRRAKPDPDQDEERIAVDPRPQDQKRRGDERARRHDGAAVTLVDEAAGRVGGQGRGAEAERVGERQGGLRPAELARHRLEEEREGVEDDAPGDELREGQRGDETPGHAGGRGGLRMHEPGTIGAAAAEREPPGASPERCGRLLPHKGGGELRAGLENPIARSGEDFGLWRPLRKRTAAHHDRFGKACAAKGAPAHHDRALSS